MLGSRPPERGGSEIVGQSAACTQAEWCASSAGSAATFGFKAAGAALGAVPTVALSVATPLVFCGYIHGSCVSIGTTVSLRPYHEPFS